LEGKRGGGGGLKKKIIECRIYKRRAGVGGKEKPKAVQGKPTQVGWERTSAKKGTAITIAGLKSCERGPPKKRLVQKEAGPAEGENQ